MLNQIIVMGRLTRDPELRRTNSGKPVASFTVAVDRDYAAEGQEKETDFIDCVAWQGTAEFVEKYFKKGSMIVVSGRLQLRNWTDKEGNKRRSAEILAGNVYFGESKKSQEGSNPPSGQSTYPGASSAVPQSQQSYGGYQPQFPQQGYGYPQQPFNQSTPAPNMPAYAQQGFGSYPQGGYQNQGYHPPQDFAHLEGDDEQLPF